MKAVSVTDVVCTTTTAAASAVLALEIANDFLVNMRREGKNFMEEINNRISGHVISVNTTSTRIQSALEKAAGKLSTKQRVGLSGKNLRVVRPG